MLDGRLALLLPLTESLRLLFSLLLSSPNSAALGVKTAFQERIVLLFSVVIPLSPLSLTLNEIAVTASIL